MYRLTRYFSAYYWAPLSERQSRFVRWPMGGLILAWTGWIFFVDDQFQGWYWLSSAAVLVMWFVITPAVSWFLAWRRRRADPRWRPPADVPPMPPL